MKKYRLTILKLIKYNWFSLLMFEVVYRVFANVLLVKTAEGALNFSLKYQGSSYMTSENFNTVMLHPLTILLMFGVLILVLFLFLLETCAVFGAMEMAWRRERLSVPGMIRISIRGSLYFIRRYPLTWPFYMACCFPYLGIFACYSAFGSRKLLQVSATNLIGLFPEKWIPVVLIFLLFAASMIFSYSLPFRILMEEKESRVRKRTLDALRGKWRKEIGRNLLLQMILLLIGVVLFFVGDLCAVLYAMIVKSPSTVVSAVIVYGDWVKTISGIVFSGMGTVGSLAYLYRIFVSSERKGYRKTRPTKRQNGILVRMIRSHTVTAVSTILLMAAVGVYALYAIRNDLPSATASSGYISVSAHRGGARKAPENTLSALAYAVESMSDYAEIDVQETSDGEIVLMHDSNLKRTTGLNANIWTLAYDEIRQLDAGVRFNKSFRGEYVPKLEEAISYAKGKIKLNIEVKYNGHNKNIVKKVVKIIEDNDFVDNCVLTSMNYNFLRQAKELNPDIKTGYTMKMTYGGLEDLEAADFFSVKYTYVNEAFVSEAHALGKEVCAWTLNYQGDMQRMAACGVDNIITDDPELVRKVILGNTDRRPGFWDLLGYALK